MEQVAASIVAAIGIALITFFSKKVKKGREQFDFKKIGRTVLIGLGLGVIAYYQDYNLTLENYQQYMSTNIGIIAVLDQGIKFVWNLISKYISVEV